MGVMLQTLNTIYATIAILKKTSKQLSQCNFKSIAQHYHRFDRLILTQNAVYKQRTHIHCIGKMVTMYCLGLDSTTSLSK